MAFGKMIESSTALLGQFIQPPKLHEETSDVIDYHCSWKKEKGRRTFIVVKGIWHCTWPLFYRDGDFRGWLE